MSNAAIPLSDQDLEQIKHHLTDWMDSKLLQSQWVPGPELLERSVRVEEDFSISDCLCGKASSSLRSALS